MQFQLRISKLCINKSSFGFFFQSSKAIKQLTANHRLILSGTPIQNNVLELWSLFDFLMPGFLGTERQFTAKYSRPILASRDPKSSPSEQEAGKCLVVNRKKEVLLNQIVSSFVRANPGLNVPVFQLSPESSSSSSRKTLEVPVYSKLRNIRRRIIRFATYL